MAVKTKDELLSYLNTLTADSSDDSTLEMIQDFTDTLNNFESNSQVDWEQKYNENDAKWRKKYRDRFFGKNSENETDDNDDMHPPIDPRKKQKEELIGINDLFTPVTK